MTKENKVTGGRTVARKQQAINAAAWMTFKKVQGKATLNSVARAFGFDNWREIGRTLSAIQ